MEEVKRGYLPIENYGVIGDLRTIALVGINGSIDFMCFPNFDSPSVFASLLDCRKGGFFQIAPQEENITKKQLYLPETNILVTRFLFEEGIGEVTDFMPVATVSKENIVVRMVKSIKGKISYRMQCCPRFNYARSSHEAKRHGNEIIFKSKGEDGLCLKLISSVPMHLKKGDAYAEFTLNGDETAEFILENIQEKQMKSVSSHFVEMAFEETLKYWKSWAAKSTYNGRWREMVIRSALILKLLISQPYGAIVAAPTFSLPEKIGGHKNWDYRYSWIRDAAFTVYSLMRIGYREEAIAFMQWIQDLTMHLEKHSAFQPLYCIDGRKKLEEIELSHLEGYKQSYPVRIGNSAYQQLQLDIYGELIDSLYLYDKDVTPISHDTWIGISNQVNWIMENWKRKDSGIWEIRGDVQEFLHSKFMCWVALDRAIKIGIRRSFPFPDSWKKIRDEIYRHIYRYYWDKTRKTFTQIKRHKEVDASTLLMPLSRFISPQDPRWISTLKCIEKELVVDCFVYRYQSEEAKSFGLLPGEGTFTACSFWYIESLSRLGQLQKALVNFDKMLSYSNHLGLYAEQLGTRGEHLGNFPQALTHLALISAASDLDKRLNQKTDS